MRILIALVLGAIAGSLGYFKYRRQGVGYSKTAHSVDVGPYTFELRYLKALRDPSGEIHLLWTDELERAHAPTDPRVLVMETSGSSFARIVMGRREPDEDDHVAAVQAHLGNGWLIVSDVETRRLPITRTIYFCIVHFRGTRRAMKKARQLGFPIRI